MVRVETDEGNRVLFPRLDVNADTERERDSATPFFCCGAKVAGPPS